MGATIGMQRAGRRRARSRLAVTVGVVLAACATAEGDPAERASAGQERGTTPVESRSRPPLGRAWVIFGTDTVVAEVARTPDERAEGLMYRDELPDGTGMLFVFPDVEVRSFWMANTYVALDIAYMDPSYTIVDIVPMEPLSTESTPGAAPAMFALEVPQGWFEAHGIGIGDVATVEYGLQTGG